MSAEPGAGGLTRRSALRGAAVAGAAALVDPGAVLAAPTGPRRGIFSRPVGTLSPGQVAAVDAPQAFSLVGVEWSAPARVRIELRTRRSAGGWGPWVTASVAGHEPDRAAPGAALARFGEPVWTGHADQVQLRSAGGVHGVRLHFVAARPLPAVHAAQALPLAQPTLDAGPGQPPIIARAAWAQGQAPPSHAPEYGTVKLAFVHHSVSPNGYSAAEVPSLLLSIFDYHHYVRGFWDIAYNFAVDDFGRIWEARAGGIDQAVVGAQAGGYNQQSTGVVMLGTFVAVVPPPAALDALVHLLAWKLSLHGVPALGQVTVQVASYDAFYTPFPPNAYVSLPRVAGHRDGDLTDCPGDALYAQLPSIRPRVAQLAGTPAWLRIAAPVAAVSAGSAVVVTGRLSGLGGGGIAGAPVEIQQVGARGRGTTIATVTTDGQGAWSFTLTPAANAQLRALHRPGPAAVSDVAMIAVAPALTLALVSAAPLRVTGTVSPAGQHVTIDLYRVSHGRRHLVAAKRVAHAGGQFVARLKAPRRGRYVLIARTRASARYAAGASAPVSLTIP
jgi:hypothetical protein